MALSQPAADPVTGGPVHPLLAQAFTALDDAGVAWAVLRGRDELAGPGEDVDLLAAVPDLTAVDAALAGAGWLRLPAPGRGAHRFWFRYDPDGDRWLKLDVVDSVEVGAWHQHRLGLTAALLARRAHDGEVWRLDPVDEQWLRLAHDVLDKGRPGDRAGLVLDGPVPAAVDTRLGAGFAGALLAGGAISVPPGAHLRGLPVITARRLVRRLHSGRRFPLGGGRVVQLLGPDGAGKSTLAGSLVAELPVDAASVYLGLWRETSLERRLRPVPGCTTAVRLGRAARMCGQARWQVLRGRVVVLDRSPADGLLGDADRSLGGRLLIACALRWAPRADVVVLLDAPGELLFARKPEHPVEVLERRRQDYRLSHPAALVVDAAQPLDHVRRTALAGVWERLVRPRG